MVRMIMVLKDCEDYVEGFKVFNRTEFTQCQQCRRVHTRKGDICQECENYNALHNVKTLDDQGEEIQETIQPKGT